MIPRYVRRGDGAPEADARHQGLLEEVGGQFEVTAAVYGGGDKVGTLKGRELDDDLAVPGQPASVLSIRPGFPGDERAGKVVIAREADELSSSNRRPSRENEMRSWPGSNGFRTWSPTDQTSGRTR